MEVRFLKIRTSGNRAAILRLSAICVGGLLALGSNSTTAQTPQGLLCVANKAARSLSVVDPAAAKSIATVPESGITGHEVAASPDGHTAYVPVYGNSGVGKPGTDGQTLDVIDLASNKITRTIDFGHAVRPHCPVIGPKDGMLYVTTELDQTVSIIDPKSLQIVGTIPTGQPESHMLALSHDGSRGYTANVGPGTISVLDIHSRKTLAVIPISKNTQRVSISPDDTMVFTADQVKPRVAVIDTKTNKIVHWVDMPATPFGTTPTRDGRYLLVTLSWANKVAVVDLQTFKVVHTIDVPKAPQEILVRPDNQVAYVSCDAAHQIAAFKTSDWSIEKMIDVGAGADGLAWAGQ